VVGLDVVEVAPPYDSAEVTAYLANRVVLEALSAICVRGRAAADRSVPDPARPLLEGR
jgi:agmatinase